MEDKKFIALPTGIGGGFSSFVIHTNVPVMKHLTIRLESGMRIHPQAESHCMGENSYDTVCAIVTDDQHDKLLISDFLGDFKYVIEDDISEKLTLDKLTEIIEEVFEDAGLNIPFIKFIGNGLYEINYGSGKIITGHGGVVEVHKALQKAAEDFINEVKKE